MKILVTGGSGMVGRYLQDLILNSERDEWVFPTSSEMNLLDEAAIRNYLVGKSFDFVIHLAANVGGLYKNLNHPVAMLHDNMLMNENILTACYEAGIRKGIFLCSTCIFPMTPESYPMKEEDIIQGPPHPSNAGYGYAKRMLYLQCQNYNKEKNTCYKCISPCNLYGKYDNYHLQDSHVVPALIHRFYLATDQMVVRTGSKSLRQFMLAGDLARALVLVMDHFDTISHDHMIVATEDELITDLTKKIGAFFPSIRIQFEDVEEGIVKKTCSPARFLSLFPDFKFTSLDDGLKETVEWFQKNYDVDVRK